MRKCIILFFFLFLTFIGNSQEKYEIKELGFSIEIPEKWNKIENEDLKKSLQKFDYSDKTITDYMSKINSSLDFATFLKYNPREYTGVIPTIKIRAAKSKFKDSKILLKSIENSIVKSQKTLKDFKYIEKPSIFKISNHEVVKFSGKYKMTYDEIEYEVIGKSYYILKKGYYIYVNCIENLGKEDNSLLFDKVYKSIQLN